MNNLCCKLAETTIPRQLPILKQAPLHKHTHTHTPIVYTNVNTKQRNGKNKNVKN